MIRRHAVWFIGEGGLRSRQAAGETEDVAPQGFHLKLAGLTMCSLSVEGKRHLFMVSNTEATAEF